MTLQLLLSQTQLQPKRTKYFITADDDFTDVTFVCDDEKWRYLNTVERFNMEVSIAKV